MNSLDASFQMFFCAHEKSVSFCSLLFYLTMYPGYLLMLVNIKLPLFIKTWIPPWGNNTGCLSHPLPMGMWVVSNYFDPINDSVANSVCISFCISATFSIEEIPRSGIAGLWGKNIKHLSIYSKWPPKKNGFVFS